MWELKYGYVNNSFQGLLPDSESKIIVLNLNFVFLTLNFKLILC